MTEVFLDTSFAIALSATTDQSHVRAVDLANQLEEKGALLNRNMIYGGTGTSPNLR